LGHEIYSPVEVEKLTMPASDARFGATTESEWRQAAREDSCMSELSNLQGALHSFVTDGTDQRAAFGYLSRFGQHILLCSLVFKVRDATRLPFLYDSLESYATADLSSLKVGDSFIKSFRLFREFLHSKSQCFWIDEVSNTMDIQSLLLVTHLEISFLYCADKEQVSNGISESHREALMLALEPFRHISEHGYYEVSN
jgi:hypothetical protein